MSASVCLVLRGFSLLQCRSLFKMQRRVLVYLQRESDGNIPRKARFTQSVVNTFNDGYQNVHKAEVFLRHSDNHVILFDKNKDGSSPCHENRKLPLVRPPLCPIHQLTPDVIDQLSMETVERGIDSGCSIVLETCDGFVLLIRRAQHLRTFPGVWTPPVVCMMESERQPEFDWGRLSTMPCRTVLFAVILGGHIEENESLLEAGLREFSEETGLTINPEDCEENELRILALWESTYPPTLSLGLPIRHHIVVYFHAKLKEPFTADRLQSELRLDPEEVDASVWLDRKIVQAIVATYEESTDGEKKSLEIPSIPETITITVTCPDHEQSLATMETKPFLNRAPLTSPDRERVSTGTKFALAEWLKISDGSETQLTPEVVQIV